MTTSITWINHAGFLLECGDVALVSDPWIEGRVFDRSWSLLAPSAWTYADFERVTHIWFSHEHPDHFFPPNVRQIPEHVRGRITVLYQETKDNKVVDFCRKLGFSCQILPPGEVVSLGSGVEVVNQPHEYDSWLLVRTPDARLLNLNDVPLRRPDAVAAVKDQVGEVDVLLTQFSYANWAGNPGDAARHKAEAETYIRQMKLQIETIRPRYVIPFASFVRFAHEQNAFHNAWANRVDDIVAMLESDCGVVPVALYPGDRWSLFDAHDNAPTLAKYGDRYAESMTGLTPTETVAEPRLIEMAGDFVARLRKSNVTAPLWPIQLAGYLRPARVYLDDLGRAYVFSMLTGLRPASVARASCDIATYSDAFAFCLQNLFGSGTLAVNGRFEAPAGGDIKYFWRQFAIAAENNEGRFFPRHNLARFARHVLDNLRRRR